MATDSKAALADSGLRRRVPATGQKLT